MALLLWHGIYHGSHLLLVLFHCHCNDSITDFESCTCLSQNPEAAFGWNSFKNSDAKDFVEVAWAILELLRNHEANQEQVKCDNMPSLANSPGSCW